jgi:glycosyltransferase involved in cell wall biosynthesis
MTDHRPFFSVIIPTLNEEKYLPRLLRNLSSQYYRDFEVIVVDGSSADQTVSQAKSFVSKLPLQILVSAKSNVSNQRNLGAEKAAGKYLLFMDADVQIPPYYLTGSFYRILQHKPDAFTHWCVPDIEKPGNVLFARMYNFSLETGKKIAFESTFGAMFGCKREIFLKMGGFDAKIKFAEDRNFVQKVVRAGHSFSIFHDPTFKISLRRFRKEGTLKSVQQYARVYIKSLTKQEIKQDEDFPMGGNY